MATFAIDWDGVIHDWDHPVAGRKLGPPMLHAKEVMQALFDAGHTIIIHSCNRPEVIAKWMAFYNIPYHLIWDQPGKPVADWYVDDNALRFESWQQVLRDIG